MKAPKIPSSWDECSWEQLGEIYRLMGEYSGQRSVRNLHIWLMLSRLEFAEGEGEIAEDGEVTYWLRRADPEVKREKRKVKNPEQTGNPLFTLHSSLFTSEQSEEEFFAVKADDLSLYLNGSHFVNDNDNDDDNKLSAALRRKVEVPGALDWVDEMVGKGGHGGLTQLPIDTITIGKKEWRLPSALITSITYEQYTNAQQLQQAVWSLTDNIKQTLSNSPLKDKDSVSKEEMTSIASEVEELTKDLQRFRAQLMSHLLIPADKGAEYKSEDAEERVDFFVKHIDEHPYLLDILIQHLQSCLGVYKTQFPDLFSGDGSGSDTIPMVSEVNTINAIMKWQGYQEQQKVFDSNAIFIFSILNSMTKEAKAIEEANAKMKRHK